MKKLLIVLTILLALCGYSYAACTGSSPTWTSTPDLVSVQACVTGATRGDTINVSAGTAIWSSKLNITKAITLKGAGKDTGGTKIIFAYGTAETDTCGDCPINYGSASGRGSIKFKPTDPQADENVDFSISGFRFEQSPSVTAVGGVQIVNCSVDYPLRRIKIFDNNFIWRSDSAALQTQLMLNFVGYTYGVIYNNVFDGRHPYFYIATPNSLDATMTAQGNGCSYYGGRHSIMTYTYPGGTGDAIYFEDNTLYYRDMSGVHFGGGAFGGYFIIRYNSHYFYDDDRGYQNGWQTHGAYLYTTGGAGVEVYGNYFNGTSTSSLYRQSIMFCRSGRCLGWGNLFHAAGNQMSPFVEIHHECDESSTSAYGHACPAGTKYPGAKACWSDGQPQHPYNSYFYRNYYGALGTTLATAVILSYGDGNPSGTGCQGADGTLPRRNTDFFMHEPSNCNSDGCTSGVGCGTSLPATCTAGTGFWLTTDSGACSGLTTAKVGAGGNYDTKKQTGVLYRCAAGGNSWGTTPHYTPYTYPHPLREAGVDTTIPVTSLTSVCAGADCTTPLTCSGSATVVITVEATDNIAVSGVKACLDNGTTCVESTAYENMGLSFTQGSGNSWTLTLTDVACDESFAYNIKAIDSSGNESVNIVGSFDTEESADITDPTLDTYVLDTNGRTLTLTFSEPVRDAGEYDNTDWTFTVGGSASSITCMENWNATTLTCTTDACVPEDAVVVLKYTQPTNGIEDLAGNELATTGNLSVTNNSDQSCGAATSLWYPDVPTYTTATDQASNLGLQFTSKEAGTITHVCYYKDATLTGTHYGSVWCADARCGTVGTELSRELFTSDTGTGWKCQELSIPVPIMADVPYRVSVHFQTSAYIRTTNYFVNQYVKSNLTVPARGGVYRDATSVSYPNQSTTNSNLWVDVIISYAGVTGPWNVTASASGQTGCGIISQPTEPIADEDTAEVEIYVKNGWAVSVGGTCPTGSGVLSGNTYTWTTGSIEANCEVAVTCSEIQRLPWVAP